MVIEQMVLMHDSFVIQLVPRFLVWELTAGVMIKNLAFGDHMHCKPVDGIVPVLFQIAS